MRTHGGGGQRAAAHQLPRGQAHQLRTLRGAVPRRRRLRRRSPHQQAAADDDDLQVTLTVTGLSCHNGSHAFWRTLASH